MVAAKPVSMIATVGAQPQVVTFALDSLLLQKIPLVELIVIYLSPPNPRTQQALRKLSHELAGGYGRSIQYKPHPIHTIADIRDESDANAAWEAVNSLIRQLKSQNRTLHICISGGRRILGLLTMSAAMMHFGHQDVLWHMYTPDSLRRAADEGAMMHLPPDSGFRLIRVPMMPWGSYFPALRELAQPLEAGIDVLAYPRAVLDRVEHDRCQTVNSRLTERQQDVLRAFSSGLNPQQVAAQLHITIKTVDSHKTVILAECRNVWDIPPDTYLDYHFLANKFELFF